MVGVLLLRSSCRVPRSISSPVCRGLSTGQNKIPVSRRAMLYVPGSNPRMLEKSLASPADSICYDLEDAVALNKKAEARGLIANLLNSGKKPRGEVMVRINAIGTGLEEEDMEAMLPIPTVQAIALPKTSSPEHLHHLINRINHLSPPARRTGGAEPMRIIAMIENAIGMIRLREICEAGAGHLDGLLFAAEDYCADVGVIRTPARAELLYPRSRLVTHAKAYGLQAIDLVCVNYKDEAALQDECEEGRRLGFEGKQAIHPAQVDIIQRTYSPDEKDIRKAARVVFSFELHAKRGTGAYVLDGAMIDAPVYKQALKVLNKAKAAELEIPTITEADL